jgi:hypothetical protein
VKIQWAKLAGQLGIAYCAVGLLLVFLGWNGAATYDRVPAQIPYVISGGLAGLCLVVIGAAVLSVQNAKADRAALQASLGEVREALERLSGAAARPAAGTAPAGAAVGSGDAGMVVAGPTAYHRPTCRLVEGQSALTTMSTEAAVSAGLTPCRACAPEESAGLGTSATATTL